MLRPSRPPLGGTCLSSLASYFLPLSSAFPAIQSGAWNEKKNPKRGMLTVLTVDKLDCPHKITNVQVNLGTR